MRKKKPYVKPKITLFDLNIEPLNAQCCTTQEAYALILYSLPFCSEACCQEIIASG